jgi:arylsulfatase A-like enzyme
MDMGTPTRCVFTDESDDSHPCLGHGELRRYRGRFLVETVVLYIFPSKFSAVAPPDIILVTVDCWRHDAPEQTDLMLSFAGTRTDALCHHESTGGVFPTIFNSVYAPEFADDPSAAPSLPSYLAEKGYATGGFVAGNPFCNRWADDFNTFWNAGYEKRSGLPSLPVRAGDYFRRLMLLQPEIPAEEVKHRAKTWFESTATPRFCWLHLMEPHEPYHPGVELGRQVGLFKSYAALIQFKRTDWRTDETLPEWVAEQAERLYWACIRRLHDQLDSLLEWIPSDATVILTGDHGEEFDHGVYHHARLYDEVVRVPFYVRWTLGDTPFTTQPIRQLDIAPTVAEAIGQDPPKRWRGEPYRSDEERVTYATSDPDGSPELYAARREGTQKLVYEFDSEGELTRQERYDLKSDTKEMNPLDPEEIPETKHRDLQEHAEQHLFREQDDRPLEVGPHVRSRLDKLGYS